MKPNRIQLSRKRGWRMPPNTVKVDRTSKVFGNPFRVGQPGIATNADAVARFRMVNQAPEMKLINEEVRRTLRGKNLACWCRLCPAHATGKPLGVVCNDCAPCHADVWLEIANS